MDLAQLLKIYSRRQPRGRAKDHPIPQSFRSRLILRYLDVVGPTGLLEEALGDLWRRLVYLVGDLERLGGSNPRERVMGWIGTCSDAELLDSIELIFQPGRVSPHGLENLVADCNTFFRLDELPYAVTNYVWETRPGHGTSTISTIVEFPRIIRAESQVVHELAIRPALQVLGDGRFAGANHEFLQALEDYRKDDYPDCLTKCGSALESVLKVICQLRGWRHEERDTAAALIRTVIRESPLEPFFEQPLVLVATLRNHLSSSHGHGSKRREVTRWIAEYALNATASAMLLLVGHCLDHPRR